jgi:hypothetical protein
LKICSFSIFFFFFGGGASVFKTVILVNRRKPRVTCIFHIEKLLIFNTCCYNIVHPHLFIWRALWLKNTMFKFHLRPNNLRHCTIFPNYEMCRIWESAYTMEKGKMYCVRILQFWRKNIQKFKIT